VKVNVPKYTLACARCGRKKQSVSTIVFVLTATDVSREPKEKNSSRTPSIRRMSLLERTMWRSHYAEIRVRYCDSSTDREERSNFECPSASHHLSDDLRVSFQRLKRRETTDVWTCSCRSPFGARFLTLGQSRKWCGVGNKIYRVLPRHCQRMLFRLAKIVNKWHVISSV